MSIAKPGLKYIDAFMVTGDAVRTKNSDERDSETAKLPELWQRSRAENPNQNQTSYGVYSDYESDENGLYSVTAGTETEHHSSDVKTIRVLAGHYLVFEAEGDMPMAIINAWQAAWQYFSDNSPHQRAFNTDFERYDSDGNIALYIGIK